MKWALAVTIFALATLSASAQTFSPRTDTFVFNSKNAITSWNGSPVNNPPYPYDMGAVNISNNSGITIPWLLGYLNNGDLNPCNPIKWGPDVWIIGDGTHSGDTYTVSSGSFNGNVFTPGPTYCPYFTGEYGSYGNSSNILDGFSVTVTYVRKYEKFCGGRSGCHILPVDTAEGGTGEAQQTLINP